MNHYVIFILCKKNEVIKTWSSTDWFADRVKAMEMAQTVVRNTQNSEYTVYYKIMCK